MQMEELSLSSLEQGTPGITGPFGACLAEAADVCLEEQGHRRGTILMVVGSFRRKFILSWNQTSEQIRRCWADRDVTTENGAYAIAILLVVKITPYTILERSYRGPGFDYWLGTEDEPNAPFHNLVRLEVSGIRRGMQAQITHRVQQKMHQIQRDETCLPNLVIVVEFSEPCSKVAYNGKRK